MKEDWQIHPAVKRLVTALAWGGVGMAVITVAGSVLELLVALFGGGTVAVAFGLTAQLSMIYLICICCWLMPWCHDVLLAGRGLVETRLIAQLGSIAALLLAALTTAGLGSGRYLHPWQADLPCVCAAALAVVMITNLPNMSAAERYHRLAIVMLPLLMLGSYITNAPELFLWNDLCNIACGLLALGHLRRLGQSAPYIAGMPPTHE